MIGGWALHIGYLRAMNTEQQTGGCNFCGERRGFATAGVRCNRCLCPYALGLRLEPPESFAPVPPEANKKPAVLEYMVLVTSNRAALAQPGIYAHCIYCRSAYRGSEVVKWTDSGTTAVCPFCDVDAVLPVTMEKLDKPDHFRRVWRWHHEGFKIVHDNKGADQ